MDASSPDQARQETSRERIDEELLARYYAEFREIARRALRRNGTRVTLQPTDLAHEAMLRLLAGSGVSVRDEAHFLAIGARAIRVALIDEIRRRGTAKRDREVVTLLDERDGSAAPIDIQALDDALYDLARIEPGAARIVELRFYVGLTMAEIARELEIAESTALRRWRIARAWLLKELDLAG